MRYGGLEILVVLVLVILLFGPGRIVKVAKELGSSISAFRSGLKDKEDQPKDGDKPDDSTPQS